jgi:hypothetical protein
MRLPRLATLTAVFLFFGTSAQAATTHDVLKVGPKGYPVSTVAAPTRGGIAGAQRIRPAAARLDTTHCLRGQPGSHTQPHACSPAPRIDHAGNGRVA